MMIIAQIKLPCFNREACSNNFNWEPGEGRQKSIDELLGALQFSFTWATFRCLAVDLRTETGCYGTNLGISLLLLLIDQVRIFHLAFSTPSLVKVCQAFSNLSSRGLFPDCRATSHFFPLPPA